MKMKKLLSILMAIMIVVFVAACDSTQETAEEPEVSPAVSETVEETEAAEEQEELEKPEIVEEDAGYDEEKAEDVYDDSYDKLYKFHTVNGYSVIDKYLGDEETVTIPKVLGGKEVREIRESAFEGLPVKSVTIQEGIEEIGRYAFEYCLFLEQIELPDSIASIDIGAFKDCRSLKSIKIPSRVKEINRELFQNCVSLEYVYIPASVDSIYGEKGVDNNDSGSAFSGDKNLKTIEVSAINFDFSVEDGVLYSLKNSYGNEAGKAIFELVDENDGCSVFLQAEYDSKGQLVRWFQQCFDYNGRLVSDETFINENNDNYTDYYERSDVWEYIGKHGVWYTYNTDGSMRVQYDYMYYRRTALFSGNDDYFESNLNSYEYDSEGRLIASDYYEIEYHPNGQIKQVKYELGDLIAQNEYTSDGSLVCTKLINSEGRQVYRDEYTYDAAGNATICVGYSADGTARTQWERTFDENGNETSVKVYTWAGETAFRRVSAYDANGNLTGYKEYCGDGSLSFYKENTYDENDNILTSVSYSGDGQIMGSSEWTYDADGRETFMAEYDGEGQALYSRESEYDAAGNRVEFTENDPNGTYEYYHEVVTYDDTGKAKEKTITRDDKTVFVMGDFGEEQEVYVDEYEKFRDGAEIPLVPIKDIVDGYGTRIYAIGENGTSKIIYAFNFKMETMWYEEHIYDDEYVGIPYRTTDSTYDSAGNCLSTIETYNVNKQDEAVYLEETTYDDNGRTLTWHRRGGGEEIFEEYRRDSDGEVIWESSKLYINGVFYSWTVIEYEYGADDGKIYSTRTSYDENGNVIEE